MPKPLGLAVVAGHPLRVGVLGSQLVLVVQHEGDLAIQYESRAPRFEERIANIETDDAEHVPAHQLFVEGTLARHRAVDGEDVLPVRLLDIFEGVDHSRWQATAAIHIDAAVVVVVAVNLVGDSIAVVVEGLVRVLGNASTSSG